jgi:hypothetical protein
MGKYKVQCELKRNRKKKSAKKLCNVIQKSDIDLALHSSQEIIESELNLIESVSPLSSDNDSYQNESHNNVKSHKSIAEKLRDWAIDNNVNRIAVTDLLHILNNDRYPELPLSFKSLLKTPRKIDIFDVNPGKLIFFGLEKFLFSALEKTNQAIKILEIDVNIDGCPIFDNSKEIGAIWPILCKINNFNFKSEVFVVGVYCGKSKPDNFNELLKPFVENFISLENNLMFNGNCIKVVIRSFNLDAPARASVCGIVGHNSFAGCPKCIVKGRRINNKTVFLDHYCTLRTDNDFRKKNHVEHHKNESVLEKIKQIDMIKSFPIDYLHNMLLGIMRKLLDLFFGIKGFYAHNTKLAIDKLIETATKLQPNNFHRHIRNIEKFKIWKGTELRTFLMFIGPVVLHSTISKEHYALFMIFHVAFAILKDKQFCQNFNSIAEKLLLHFVEEFEIKFGPEHITYNFHLVTHISQDCLIYGNLDNFSCFEFESFMCKLKSYVKSPHRPLEQIHNRLVENFQAFGLNCNSNVATLKLDQKLDNIHYSKLVLNDTIISSNSCDCYVQTKDKKILQIDKFFQSKSGTFMIAFQFTNVSNIYSLPINSMDIDEFQVKLTEKRQCIINVDQIYRKFYVIEIKPNIALFFPLSTIQY